MRDEAKAVLLVWRYMNERCIPITDDFTQEFLGLLHITNEERLQIMHSLEDDVEERKAQNQ